MEKQISVWSYRLGLVSVALTIVLRGLAAIGIFPNLVPAAGAPISYNTFLRGGMLLLVLSIASSVVGRSGAKS
jgi:hypothetical membrane protein